MESLRAASVIVAMYAPVVAADKPALLLSDAGKAPEQAMLKPALSQHWFTDRTTGPP